jgi:dethiobiotin synthetase
LGPIPIGTETDIGKTVSVRIYEPLVEPVPTATCRPVTAPRVEAPPEQESQRSDVEVGQ